MLQRFCSWPKLGFLFCALPSLWIAQAASQPAFAGMFYIDGHGDIAVGYEPVDPLNPNGPKKLSPHWHLGDGAGATVVGLPEINDQEFEPDEITAVVPLTSKITNPGGPAWAFLGAAPGADVFLLPTNNPVNTVIPYLGFASDELVPADWSNLNFSITIPLSSPGAFSIFTPGFPNPNVLYSSTSGPASFPLGIGSHDHFALAFTQPGYYDVNITMSATHVTDGFQSATGTFQFLVGDVPAIPEPSSFLLLTAVGAILGRRSRRS